MLGADPEALGVRPDAPATVLAERELVPEDARAIRLFGPDGPPGARETFVAARRRHRRRRGARRPRRRRRLAGVGARRRAAARRRRRARAGRAAARRWPSRGWTSASTRPPRSPTRSREGEYIQIIDVAGRQCSDFLAFHAHKLDAGIERGLDPQVTRTLMGTRLPDRRAALEVLRRRHGPALPGRAGHRRAPRLVRAGLHRALLRGPRLPGPRQLHGELQPPARPVRDRRRRRAGRR